MVDLDFARLELGRDMEKRSLFSPSDAMRNGSTDLRVCYPDPAPWD